MTNTENTPGAGTITTVDLAAELDVTTDEVETAAFMLGISILWAYSPAQAERIRQWNLSHGGQSEDGGLY